MPAKGESQGELIIWKTTTLIRIAERGEGKIKDNEGILRESGGFDQRTVGEIERKGGEGDPVKGERRLPWESTTHIPKSFK